MPENHKAEHHPERTNGNGHDNEIENDSILPDSVLEGLPPTDRKEIVQSVTSISGIFSQQNPLLKKVNAEHITTLIECADACDKRDRDERQDERNYNFKIMVTVLFTSVLVCGLFIWTAQTDLLKFFIGAIFGFGGGFGVGKFYKKQ